MHNILIKLFTCFFIFPMVAQSNGKVYANYVNSAELYITEGHYQQALSQYEKAFETGTAFTVDLYNATVCAIKLNKKNSVINLTGKLAGKGVGERFFTKKIFDGYLEDASFRRIIAKAEPLRQQYNEVNKAYNEKLTEFVLLDKNYNKLRLTKYSEHYGALPDTLEMLFRTNTRDLFDHIKKYGFYTEEKLGAPIAKDTVINVSRDADIVFLHYLEMGKDQKLLEDIKNLYLANLQEGKIPPYHVYNIVRMAEFIFGDVGEYAFKVYQCKLYKMDELPEPLKVAECRQEYLLDSIDDYGRKLVFIYGQNEDFIFNHSLIKGGYIDEEFLDSSYSVITEINDCRE